MLKVKRAPRSSKVEAEANKEKLRKLWLRAFEQEEPLYLKTSSKKEALRLRSLLADFRRNINSKKLENLELWSKIYSLSLRLEDTVVILEHKTLDKRDSGLLLTKVLKPIEGADNSTEFDRLIQSVLI